MDPTPQVPPKKWQRPLNWGLGGIIIIACLYYAARTLFGAPETPAKLVVYAYSTQEEVLTQGIFPAFEQHWEGINGRELTMEAIFGPSGTLAGQINLGAPADVAIFSNRRHVDWLKLGKQVDKKSEPVWIASTPLVILTRAGNPAGISAFSDLAQPGLDLLHADPRSSGEGEWAILAEYGSAYLVSHDQAAAEAQLKGIWKNVKLVAPSARATLTLFELGSGEALVTYEQDALLAQERGIPLEIITPAHTILARHFAVLVDDNLTTAERPIAEAFLNFIGSPQGQEIMAQYYFRPTGLAHSGLPFLEQPFTEEDLGGWTQAYTTLVEGLWQTEILPSLSLGPAAAFWTIGE
jgi:ABC-type sulfate transport system substrate-binding protein